MVVKCAAQNIGERHAIYCGDCCEIVPGIPDSSIGFTVFSPPFADLYCYSDNERDMGNCGSYDVFFEQFRFLIKELERVTMPGRIVAVHCMDIPAMKERDGYIGLKDFPGEIIRSFQNAGMIYHSRHIIWKDPLIEATRTKALGLMHKQLCKDSSMCRAGLPDYVLAFRKSGENPIPISQGDGISHYAGGAEIGGAGLKRSHNIWRAYASPVWMDIRQTRTLNKSAAREVNDEKHICPLQLDVIERCITLWSIDGDTVLTPFMGIGSECYQALIMGRRAVGIELKRSYYDQAERNVLSAIEYGVVGQGDMFQNQ